MKNIERMQRVDDVILLVFNTENGTSFVRVDQVIAIVACDPDIGFHSEIMLLGGGIVFAKETPDELLENMTSNG